MIQLEDLIATRMNAHEAYLRVSAEAQRLIEQQIDLLQTIQSTRQSPESPITGSPVSPNDSIAPPRPVSPPRSLTRDQCMEFAIGNIGNALGTMFAEVDRHPTRVRLPDEPLMLRTCIIDCLRRGQAD
mgnify:CR=1 FL=1